MHYKFFILYSKKHCRFVVVYGLKTDLSELFIEKYIATLKTSCARFRCSAVS